MAESTSAARTIVLRTMLHSTMADDLLSIGRLMKSPSTPRGKLPLQIKLRPFIHQSHHSHLELAIILHWVDDQGNQRTADACYRFSAGNVAGDIEVAQISDRSPAAARELHNQFPHIPSDEFLRYLATDDHQYWRLVLRHAPGHPYASNLFNAVTYGQPIDRQLDLLRAHLSSDGIQQFTLLVCADDLPPLIQSLNDRFMLERVASPLDAFYENKAQYIQLGQIKKPGERPCYQLGRLLTYQTWQEYYTLQGYGAVQEYEFNREITSSPMECMLRIVRPHNDNDNVYLAFMDTYDTDGLSTRFQPDERLSVQFTRIKTQDFNARVAEPLAYAGLNDTTLIITRPFDGAGGNFIDLDLGRRVISGNFKTTAEARRSIRDARPRKAIIQGYHSDTVIKRQLNSLRELQKHAAAEVQTLLQANRFDRLTRYDAFETLGDRAAEIVEQVCDGFNNGQREVIDLLRNLPGGLGLVVGPPGTGKTFVITRVTMAFLLCSPAHPIQLFRPSETTVEIPPVDTAAPVGDWGDGDDGEPAGNQEDDAGWDDPAQATDAALVDGPAQDDITPAEPS